jgi:hypothetical protein
MSSWLLVTTNHVRDFLKKKKKHVGGSYNTMQCTAKDYVVFSQLAVSFISLILSTHFVAQLGILIYLLFFFMCIWVWRCLDLYDPIFVVKKTILYILSSSVILLNWWSFRYCLSIYYLLNDNKKMCVIYTNEIQTLIRQTHIKYNLDVCSVQRENRRGTI